MKRLSFLHSPFLYENITKNFNLKSLCDPIRLRTYSADHWTYDGQYRSFSLCIYLKEFFPEGKIHAINQKHNILIWKECIIDPTYRLLFIDKRGDASKLTSPYAEFLYCIQPAVLVMEMKELKEFEKKLEDYRKKDILHRDDNIEDRYGKL